MEQRVAEPIVREIDIDAPPEVVFEFFVDADHLTRWLCVEATVDPRPGGVCVQVHQDLEQRRHRLEGTFLEVDRPRRVAFTWGWASPDSVVPPGSSVVEVTLEPLGGGTRVRLVHRDLPAAAVEDHAGGWTIQLDRLARAVMTGSREHVEES
jgi:uncharacterized protein YndB with AHSA1/START domain